MKLGRSSLMGLGSVAAPVAIFLFLKVTIGLGPAPSPAQSGSSPEVAPVPAGGPAATPTPEQTRAISWLKSQDVEADLPSPLEHADPQPAPPPVEPAAAPAPDPLQGVRVSALLSTSQGGYATINGKLYHPGETVLAGYTLRSIDVRGQRVEIAGPDGTSRWIERQP